MRFNDDFLQALGAWQNGWRENPERRLSITAELLGAIDTLESPLPKRSPSPVCYRKRFLRPKNPQNPIELSQLILAEEIHDGVASWTTDPEYGRGFKDLLRPDHITALFEHRPLDQEVIVDIPALWEQADFKAAVTDYAARNGVYANALTNFSDKQSEIILSAPLRVSEVFGLVGQIGSYEALFALAGANSDDQQDALIDQMIEHRYAPGQARWIGRTGAQRALQRTQARIDRRIVRLVKHKSEIARLLTSSSALVIAAVIAGV